MKRPPIQILTKAPTITPKQVQKKRPMSVDNKKSSSFIINKKSSIVSSKFVNSPLQNMLFDDVPISVKQTYIKQLEQQITDLSGLKCFIEMNITKQQNGNGSPNKQAQQAIQLQSELFRQEILNIQQQKAANPQVLEQSIQLSQLLQCHSEQQQIDPQILEISYFKDLQQYKEQLKTSNKFVPFENEFL